MLTHSRNPKTPQICSFFSEKWLLIGVLAGQIDKNLPTSKLASDFCLFDPDIFVEKQQIGGYMTNSIKNGKLIINGEDVYELDEDCLIRSGVKPVS